MKINLNTYVEKSDKSIVVVKITTSYWNDKRGGHVKKDINFLRKKCRFFNFFDEDMYSIGAEESISRITNIYDVEDGVYELITVNESTDWETGNVEDWDYKLVPYVEKATPKNGL